MRIPKKYGESWTDKCPFCGKQATTINNQNIPVCSGHKNASLEEMKCLCGEYLEIKHGKYGVYFFCIKCGNISAARIFEINNTSAKNSNTGDGTDGKQKTIITTTSDDPRFFV